MWAGDQSPSQPVHRQEFKFKDPNVLKQFADILQRKIQAMSATQMAPREQLRAINGCTGSNQQPLGRQSRWYVEEADL